jgi:hypothetical protein
MHRKIFRILAALTIVFSIIAIANAQGRSNNKTAKKESLVTKHSTGTFEVKITPLPAEENVGDPLIGRLSLEKTFSGGMQGTSKGQMLGIDTGDKGSGGYVAAERFVGTLDGKKGSFSLQHSGTMQGGKFDLQIIVVPGSGTDELAGIAGTFRLTIEGKAHSYDLEYTLPSKP